MYSNPILSVSLAEVMRPAIALPLQQVLRLYTVGDFLHAWANPRNHQSIELLFDSPHQAQHAASVCAAWIGIRSEFTPTLMPIDQWWANDEAAMAAV